MAAGAGTHQNEPVDAGLERFFRVAHVDHVVQHDAAVGVDFRHHVVRRPQARNRDRHLVPDADLDVVLEAVVRLLHDLVDGIGRGLGLSRERGFDVRQPFIERLFRSRIERRERTDDASLALLDHQLWIAGDEHRRRDHRDAQALQDRGKRHPPYLLTGSAQPEVEAGVVALALRVQFRSFLQETIPLLLRECVRAVPRTVLAVLHVGHTAQVEFAAGELLAG